jgi:DNA (cytosine-5)-methyltransferase 1
MRVLNLYCGIGGNRKLWGDEHEITAVEFDKKRASKYAKLFPNDNVIVADAHQYLLDHYQEFDFIWSSPPCQTHSRANYFIQYITNCRYPDMKLWQEIIFLENFCKTKWCVENVISYYQYFIPPNAKIGRHYLWSNFVIPKIKIKDEGIGTMMKEYRDKPNHAMNKKIEDRNAVNAELALHIINRAFDIVTKSNVEQKTLFDEEA